MLRTPKAEGSARPRMRCDMNKSVQSPCELFLSCLWGLRLQKLYLQWSCQADLHYPRCHLKISWISILIFFFFFKCQICSKVFYGEIKKNNNVFMMDVTRWEQSWVPAAVCFVPPWKSSLHPIICVLVQSCLIAAFCFLAHHLGPNWTAGGFNRRGPWP